MKEMARRFSASFTHKGDMEEMRLLPRPLYRYADPASEIVDGAVFAFTSTGTNPNAFLIFELMSGVSGAIRNESCVMFLNIRSER